MKVKGMCSTYSCVLRWLSQDLCSFTQNQCNLNQCELWSMASVMFKVECNSSLLLLLTCLLLDWNWSSEHWIEREGEWSEIPRCCEWGLAGEGGCSRCQNYRNEGIGYLVVYRGDYHQNLCVLSCTHNLVVTLMYLCTCAWPAWLCKMSFMCSRSKL